MYHCIKCWPVFYKFQNQQICIKNVFIMKSNVIQRWERWTGWDMQTYLVISNFEIGKVNRERKWEFGWNIKFEQERWQRYEERFFFFISQPLDKLQRSSLIRLAQMTVSHSTCSLISIKRLMKKWRKKNLWNHLALSVPCIYYYLFFFFLFCFFKQSEII